MHLAFLVLPLLSLRIKRKEMPQTKSETVIRAADVLDDDGLVTNPWDFGFCTVCRGISAFCMGTEVKQSLDGQRADVVDIICGYFLQSAQGIAFILLSTEEGHLTASDQGNVSRSKNCHSLVEAVKLSSFSSLLAQRPGEEASKHLGPCVDQTCVGYDRWTEKHTFVIVNLGISGITLLLLHNSRLLWWTQCPFHRTSQSAITHPTQATPPNCTWTKHSSFLFLGSSAFCFRLAKGTPTREAVDDCEGLALLSQDSSI